MTVRPKFVRRKALASDALRLAAARRVGRQDDVHREALEAGKIVGRDCRLPELPELGMCDSLDQVNLRSTRRHRSVERDLRAARARGGSSRGRSEETGASAGRTCDSLRVGPILPIERGQHSQHEEDQNRQEHFEYAVGPLGGV